MSARLALAALAVAAVAVAVIFAASGADPYTLRVGLDNASGLKNDSPVVIGGVKAGEVELRLGPDDRPEAELRIDPEVAPVGKDVRIEVTATNFLGQKRVVLDRGDTSKPLASGAAVPRAQVTTPTDLDQVLAVLDADTRARATILLNEAGEAMVGRKVDIRTLLAEFPIGLVDASRVLRKVEADNHSLRDLIGRSDRFVAAAADKRRDLSRMVDVLGQTSKTFSGRRAQLRQTLARAPRTLATLQRFLGELEETTKPLGPAARQISATAPALSTTLAQVDPFTRAAAPTLDDATDVAPELTRLADGATPVLRRALPTAASLNKLSDALPGLTGTLDGSSDNILAILENWSRAIQFRDGLGHVFRGEASITPDIFQTMVDRLMGKSRRSAARAKTRARSKKRAPAPAAPGSPTVKRPAAPLVAPLKPLLDALPGPAGKLLERVLPAASPRDGDQALLLDFLLSP